MDSFKRNVRTSGDLLVKVMKPREGGWGSKEGYPMQMHIKRDCVIER